MTLAIKVGSPDQKPRCPPRPWSLPPRSLVRRASIREIVRRLDAPLSPNGDLTILKVNLCPDGAVFRTAGPGSPRHRCPARVFESEEAAQYAVANRV
jgi:dihydroxyacid dehydratase/phosphogluconate dehydratase